MGSGAFFVGATLRRTFGWAYNLYWDSGDCLVQPQ